MPIATAAERSLLAPVQRAFSRDAVQEAEHHVAAPTVVKNAPKVSADAYQRAADRLEKRIGAERKLQGPEAKGKFRIMPHDESLFVSAGPNAKGTVLAFHGFTAGPWQYEELAKRLKAEGYNVYAPRLPGHGFATPEGRATNEGFVGAGNRQKFEAYIEARYQEAAALGAPVYTLGLSGGSDVALATAERHGEVKGVFAMAPFLGPNGRKNLLFDAIRTLDRMTFGLFGRLLDHVNAGKNGLVAEQGLTPHNKSTVGQALAIEQLGERVQHIASPVQLVTTEGDMLAGTHRVNPLYQRTGGAAKNGWFHFAAGEDIKHAMISPRENPHAWSVTKLQQMIVDFLNGELTVRRPAGMQ